MSKHYISPRVLCPYYKHEDPQMVYCDGVVEGAVTHEAFGNKPNAESFKKKYCRSSFEECRIYKMLKEIYK